MCERRVAMRREAKVRTQGVRHDTAVDIVVDPQRRRFGWSFFAFL